LTSRASAVRSLLLVGSVASTVDFFAAAFFASIFLLSDVDS
jgi:hypothetical protein